MERSWKKITDECITQALAEDIGSGDITTAATVPSDITSTAFIFNKDNGVLAGIDVAMKVFHTIDPELKTTLFFHDGDTITKGQKIADITGSVASILTAERTALNFLGRMTGIASQTSQYVAKTNGSTVKILDTRKTMPTMRHLDKYAVKVGGGFNHRFGLFDMILVKDNHIAVSGGIRIAVEQAVAYMKEHSLEMKIEVECKSYEQVLEAVYTPVDIIMLDNMDISETKKSVKLIRDVSVENGRTIRIEASGNVSLTNVRDIAETGVDYISIGSLTHSVLNHDFSLLFNEF